MSAVITEAIRVLGIESEAIRVFSDKLSGDIFAKSFEEAVNLIASCEGKVILSGIGKSGQVARKVASTLSSTGTPALFLHPAEGAHGDLGVVTKNDLIIVFSYGGGSQEINSLLAYAARNSISLIALTGNLSSQLSEVATVSIDVSVKDEACPLKLAPTASSTLSLAVGDALAMCVLKEKGFKEKDFAEFHPGGALGKKLLTKVSDVMHKGEAMPLVSISTPMSEVLTIITAKDVRGVAAVVNADGVLEGAITDGDIRRSLKQDQNILSVNAETIMSITPKTIDINEMAQKALFIMQEFKIQNLFCVDRTKDPKKPIGIIHIQDLLRL